MKSKYIKQGLLIIIEVLVISTALAYLTGFMRPICDSLELIERIVFCFVVYEIIVFLLSKNMLDARKDTLLMYKNLLSLTILYCETKLPDCQDAINNIIERVLKKDVFLHKDKYVTLEGIKVIINLDEIPQEKVDYLKMMQVFADHEYETEDLKWNFTILLKWFK